VETENLEDEAGDAACSWQIFAGAEMQYLHLSAKFAAAVVNAPHVFPSFLARDIRNGRLGGPKEQASARRLVGDANFGIARLLALHRDLDAVHVQHDPLRGIDSFRLGDEFAVEAGQAAKQLVLRLRPRIPRLPIFRVLSHLLLILVLQNNERAPDRARQGWVYNRVG
jgi:hypothetical protein